MSATRLLRTAARPHSGRVELAALAVLYGAYELVRGFGGENWVAARANTADIVALERHIGLFVERDVQAAFSAIAGAPALLGFLYVALHFGGTGAALVWVHRRHPHAFAHLRTTLIVSTALALTGYILYPAAPPRLADLGFADTVSTHTGLNLSSDLLGSLYNPIAAVPSLHFGYALAVGVALARVSTRRGLRIAFASYPVLMLLVIVATGNHFFFDALAGGLVIAGGWWFAGRVAEARPVLSFPQALGQSPTARGTATAGVRQTAPQDAWTPHSAPSRARAA